MISSKSSISLIHADVKLIFNDFAAIFNDFPESEPIFTLWSSKHPVIRASHHSVALAGRAKRKEFTQFSELGFKHDAGYRYMSPLTNQVIPNQLIRSPSPSQDSWWDDSDKRNYAYQEGSCQQVNFLYFSDKSGLHITRNGRNPAVVVRLIQALQKPLTE